MRSDLCNRYAWSRAIQRRPVHWLPILLLCACYSSPVPLEDTPSVPVDRALLGRWEYRDAKAGTTDAIVIRAASSRRYSITYETASGKRLLYTGYESILDRKRFLQFRRDSIGARWHIAALGNAPAPGGSRMVHVLVGGKELNGTFDTPAELRAKVRALLVSRAKVWTTYEVTRAGGVAPEPPGKVEGGAQSGSSRSRPGPQPRMDEKQARVVVSSARAAAQVLACEQRNYAACEDAAMRYDLGDGLPQDAKRAAELFDRACEGGRVGSCYNGGRMYETGEGVSDAQLPKNEPRAAVLYGHGCRGGDARSCRSLGRLYEMGRGVPKNLSRALSSYRQQLILLERGCAANQKDSCHDLASWYHNSYGVPAQVLSRDKARALELYRKSCGLGNAAACNAARRLSGSE